MMIKQGRKPYLCQRKTKFFVEKRGHPVQVDHIDEYHARKGDGQQ